MAQAQQYIRGSEATGLRMTRQVPEYSYTCTPVPKHIGTQFAFAGSRLIFDVCIQTYGMSVGNWWRNVGCVHMAVLANLRMTCMPALAWICT